MNHLTAMSASAVMRMAAMALSLVMCAVAHAQDTKPNILVIFGMTSAI
jgi:hypothetical protein